MYICLGLDVLELPLGIPIIASEEQQSWPILNLIFWILGLLLACGLAIRAMDYRRLSELDNDDTVYKVNRLLFTASLLFAVSGALYFLWNVEMVGSVVLADSHTVWGGVFLALETLSGFASFSKKNKTDEELERVVATKKTTREQALHADMERGAWQESDG